MLVPCDDQAESGTASIISGLQNSGLIESGIAGMKGERFDCGYDSMASVIYNRMMLTSATVAHFFNQKWEVVFFYPKTAPVLMVTLIEHTKDWPT